MDAVTTPATRASLSALLRHDICEVTFTKADGSNRYMIGTLKPEFLPDNECDAALSPTAEENPNIVVLWDMEKDAWRSFRIDRLISFQVASEEVQKACAL